MFLELQPCYLQRQQLWSLMLGRFCFLLCICRCLSRSLNVVINIHSVMILDNCRGLMQTVDFFVCYSRNHWEELQINYTQYITIMFIFKIQHIYTDILYSNTDQQLFHQLPFTLEIDNGTYSTTKEEMMACKVLLYLEVLHVSRTSGN